MDPKELVQNYPRVAAFIERLFARFPFLESWLRAIPSVRRQAERETESTLQAIGDSLKPYRKSFTSYPVLPAKRRSRPSILKEIQKMKSMEESRWKEGYVSGAVYHGESDHIAFLNKAYALQSQTNPLHFDLWPSINKFESEIISMTAHMLGATDTGPVEERVCGSVSSGGTESILLAMKAYRDYARAKRGITRPNLVVPVTAHAAFDKAAKYFKIKLIRVPVGPDFRVDIAAMKRAANRNTIAMVGSAPSFPHGAIDPIRELSEFARQRGIGFHTDACLGGFVLPFARKLGYHVPPFDFSLPGVTSMSADTHKFGYAAKGTSVVLYRGEELRSYQYYTVTDWPGGLYFSPTFAGSRPGGLIAACWAAMLSFGEEGYLEAAKSILQTSHFIKSEIQKMPELHLMGDPSFVIAFGSDTLDIYKVMDFLTKRHWNLNGLHKPSCLHICVTLRHTKPGVAKRFIKDLRDAVAHVVKNPGESGGMAPVYGMAATLPVRSLIGDLLKKYMDVLYRV
ncbi:MAG: aminotransferase class V-fold PLP-dependent enzyme [Leptospirales bacterium]|nr:aminotransferase class V-fold PLP-dependent enzyme [Leptospirales bacterium]